MACFEFRLLTALKPPPCLIGGVAEEFLLHGVVRPGHQDVDILTTVQELETVAAQLLVQGFVWQPDDEQPGRPCVFRQDASIPFGVWTCVATLAGEYVILLPGREGRLFRLTLPANTFQHPLCHVEGHWLHTASPLALYRLRAASAQTRHEGAAREHDLAVMAQLRTAFRNTADEGAWKDVLEEV
jgi:hypothetical protein